MNAVELRQYAGCTYRQMDYWERTGRIRSTRPAGDDVTGSGFPREFDGDEALICKRMVQLIEGGIGVPTAADVARRSVEQGRTVLTIAEGISISFDPPEMHPTATDLAAMKGQPR